MRRIVSLLFYLKKKQNQQLQDIFKFRKRLRISKRKRFSYLENQDVSPCFARRSPLRKIRQQTCLFPYEANEPGVDYAKNIMRVNSIFAADG